jgi:hypothetical protein
MSKHNFYYDESEHSRKINHNAITAHNYYDNFIAVVVGWHSKNETELFGRNAAFEEKYKHRKSKGELKSTTIKQGQFKNGFASLNNANIDLSEDFFIHIRRENSHLFSSHKQGRISYFAVV